MNYILPSCLLSSKKQVAIWRGVCIVARSWGLGLCEFEENSPKLNFLQMRLEVPMATSLKFLKRNLEMEDVLVKWYPDLDPQKNFDPHNAFLFLFYGIIVSYMTSHFLICHNWYDLIRLHCLKMKFIFGLLAASSSRKSLSQWQNKMPFLLISPLILNPVPCGEEHLESKDNLLEWLEFLLEFKKEMQPIIVVFLF